MVKKNKESYWWKILIVLTFLISLICLVLIIPRPVYSYETKHIVLDNRNMFEYWNVVDYTCDEGVTVNNHRFFRKAIYASTWDGTHPKPKANYGQCLFKIKNFEGWRTAFNS